MNQEDELRTKIAMMEARHEEIMTAHSELLSRLSKAYHERDILKDLDFLTEYQQFVDAKTSKDYNERDHALLGMMSEVGEVADAVKKAEVYGKDVDALDGGIFEEVGDLMFYVCMMCTSQGFLLKDALEHNIEKLNKRYAKGFTKEEAALRRDKE